MTLARRRLGPALLVLALLGLADRARGWEAATTHAGLTEQAALVSYLHERLSVQFGLPGGLYEALVIPPADAPDLFAVLRRMNPTHGYVPDVRGRQSALAWLTAGSALADDPAALASNHFLDPTSGHGLGGASPAGLLGRLRHHLVAILRGEDSLDHGVPASDWIIDPNNPMGIAGFESQYAKAVLARTPGERSRHLAGALLAAGAMLHVLEDMGSPSHVRNDLAAHLEQLSGDPADTGSRFEHIAALAYGRLGVPAPAAAEKPRPLQRFFTATDGSGLADRIARSWFSAGTLPADVAIAAGASSAEVTREVNAHLARPAPTVQMVNLVAGARDGGASLTNGDGTCLARYEVDHRQVHFSLDDDCVLAELEVILPETAAYAAGLLETLFRGSLALEVEGGGLVVSTAGGDLGAGKLTLLWDDARGVRTAYATDVAVTGAARGKALARGALPPAGSHRVTALFRGVDAAGDAVLATGTLSYPPP